MAPVPSFAEGSPGRDVIAVPLACDALEITPPKCSFVFWEGVSVDHAQVADSSLCGVAGPCFDYAIDVGQSDPGSRLRVALTAVLADPGDVRPWADFLVKSPEMLYEIRLYKPGLNPESDPATCVKQNNNLHGYSGEIWVGGRDADCEPLGAPAAGTWTIRVVPVSVLDMSFRMRAKLETPPILSDKLQYPDLRLNPPFELSFSPVASSFEPGVTVDHDGPRASCMVEEVEESVRVFGVAPQLCLRFSMGVENVGLGVFDLIWIRPAALTDALIEFGGGVERPRLQKVCDIQFQNCQFRPDRGSTTTFHAFHAHDHWTNGWSVTLFRIADPGWTPDSGRPSSLQDFQDARKIGFNPGPELMAAWERFYQNQKGAVPPGDGKDCFNNTDGGPCGGIVLQAGWADLYEWNRGGNYVDFPQALPLTPAPGFYLLRGVVDPKDEIVESDETNNVSYALFEVHGDGYVDLIERGYGLDPWDHKKQVSLVAP